MILKIHLEMQGYSVEVVHSPLDALDILNRIPFFLIITDIAMSPMDGYDFITEAKGRGCESQISLMTGFGYDPGHTLVKIHAEGRFSIIFKPFEFKKSTKIIDIVKKAHAAYHADL